MDAEECHDFPDHTLHRADRCGDLNLRREFVTWSRAGEGHLVPEVAEHRATEAEGGKQDRLQARKIFNIVEKYRMASASSFLRPSPSLAREPMPRMWRRAEPSMVT